MPSIRADNVVVVHPISGQSSSSSGIKAVSKQIVRDDKGRMRGVKALDGVSFDFADGERVGIVGRNGSGKTTLLRVLAGIIPPASGEVRVEGHSTNLININLGSKDDATGHRNITLQGVAHGHSREEIEARRADIVEFSELGEFLDLPVYTYSAGMRMRLSFAVATAFDPGILLLDEWLSAGDEAFKRKAKKRMQSFADRAGVLVLASHSGQLLRETCSKGLWLENGVVRELGPIDDVINAYKASVDQSAK